MIDLLTAQKLDKEDVLAGFKNYFENNSNETSTRKMGFY